MARRLPPQSEPSRPVKLGIVFGVPKDGGAYVVNIPFYLQGKEWVGTAEGKEMLNAVTNRAHAFLAGTGSPVEVIPGDRPDEEVTLKVSCLSKPGAAALVAELRRELAENRDVEIVTPEIDPDPRPRRKKDRYNKDKDDDMDLPPKG